MMFVVVVVVFLMMLDEDDVDVESWGKVELTEVCNICNITVFYIL